VPKKEENPEHDLHVKIEDVAKKPTACIPRRATKKSGARKRPSASVSGAQSVLAIRARPAATLSKGATLKRQAPSSATSRSFVMASKSKGSFVTTSKTTCSSVAAAQASGAVWWKCPRCDFSVAASMPVMNRNSLKSYHIRNNHGNSKTAESGNYLRRGNMLRAVWEGALTQTPGRVKKGDLKINAKGRVVPKRRSAHSSKVCKLNGWADNWRKWCHAAAAVRQEQGITGFAKLNKADKSPDNSLYVKVLERWAKSKANSMTLASAGV